MKITYLTIMIIGIILIPAGIAFLNNEHFAGVALISAGLLFMLFGVPRKEKVNKGR